MKTVAALTRIAVMILQFLFRPFAVRRRVVFVSYFSQKPEGSLACVLEHMLARGDVPVRTLFCKYGRGFGAKLKYVLHTVKEVWFFSTSSLIVLEGNSFTLSCMKKKTGVTAVQMWHAAGAFKKFGADTERLYSISGLDAALVSCPAVREVYSRALSVPLEHVYAIGIPRADVFLRENFAEQARLEVEKEYPELCGKKIVLYAPTFRGGGIDDVHMQSGGLSELPEGYALAVRLHPMLRGGAVGSPDFARFDLMTALAAADVLITDYSSVIFEYSLLGRPMLFYCPDKDKYADERGFYFGFEQFVPGRICETAEEVNKALMSGDFAEERLSAFCGRFTYGYDGKATARAAEALYKLLDGDGK